MAAHLGLLGQKGSQHSLFSLYLSIQILQVRFYLYFPANCNVTIVVGDILQAE